MLTATILLPLTLLTAAQSAASEPTYPELQIDAFLLALMTGLKRNLPDAYSIRDLVVCEPTRIRIRDGHAASWTVLLALNAKGPGGGYTGLTAYTAVFKEGRATALYVTSAPNDDGFNSLINRSLMTRVAQCRPIPQNQVQALLDTAPAL